MKKYILTSFIALFSFVSLVGAEEYTFSRDLSAGTSGDDVTALQSWLISSGYDIPAISSNVAIKGYFGSQTRQALMKYQLSIGLPNTGYFGPLTRGRIHDGYRGNSLVVTSPNGGEVWQKGTMRNITWNSTVKPGITEKFNYTADIKLAYPLPACAKSGANPMCMVKMRAPYTIAKGVSLSNASYSWNVGKFISDVPALPYCVNYDTNGICLGSETLVEDGKYTIQVCPTNGSQCDESNSEFTITSGDVSSKVPVINGIDAPTTLTINQTGTWTVRATDPQNGSLSYSVDWGDVQDIYANLPPGSTAEPFPFVQNVTFTHSYAASGTYTVRFKVRNNVGLMTQSSVTVVVSSGSSGTLQVTSPNGGEIWKANSNQAITWVIGGSVDANTKVDISLYSDTPCPAGYTCSPLPPYVLDKNIAYNSTYYWITATDINNNIIPDNSYYKILVCITGTSKCDRSDNIFTIN